MLKTERLVAGLFEPPDAEVPEHQKEQQQKRETRHQRRERRIETHLSGAGGGWLIDRHAAVDYLAFGWFGFGVRGHFTFKESRHCKMKIACCLRLLPCQPVRQS